MTMIGRALNTKPRGIETMPNSATNTKTKTEWEQAAVKAREAAACVGEMAGHAAAAAGALASQAATDAGKRANEFATRAGSGIHSWGDRLDQQGPHDGLLGNASQSVAHAFQESGQYIESAGLSGITKDMATVIRRNPLPAIMIAIGFGWFVGRKL